MMNVQKYRDLIDAVWQAITSHKSAQNDAEREREAGWIRQTLGDLMAVNAPTRLKPADHERARQVKAAARERLAPAATSANVPLITGRECPTCNGFGKLTREQREAAGLAELDTRCPACNTSGFEVVRAITDFEPKPIPFRGFDWIATLEGYDGAPDSPTRHQVGYGSTQVEALADLQEQVRDEQPPKGAFELIYTPGVVAAKVAAYGKTNSLIPRGLE
jgi:hypothetical protein